MQQLQRSMSFERQTVDADKRTVEVAFSSEEPVQRWFGKEILSHEPGACDLSRLNGGAAVLFNHDWDDQIGVVERAWVDADKKAAPSCASAIPPRRRKSFRMCRTASCGTSRWATKSAP
ncbi:hypothetical protein [Neisseria subflava]|uniref:hypothetical protein n=1 Tax=Neisseria subflava TaxID=28449 RepID=UPI002029E3D3|nr:hypothetical protein [Neisseria subflava]